ncbi:hypothetical protein EV14_2152 [Prochlorococcus sp. MIT 0703]|nr:hypothetical protein EV14_2152 [Prochlorococcus sp. MIT 0703]
MGHYNSCLQQTKSPAHLLKGKEASGLAFIFLNLRLAPNYLGA